MIRRAVKLIVITFTLLAVVFTSISPVLAQGPVQTPDKRSNVVVAKKNVLEIEKQNQKLDKAIKLLEPHLVIKDDGLLYFDVDNGAAIGIDEYTFSTLQIALDNSNALLRSKKISLSQIRMSTEKSITGQVVTEESDLLRTPTATASGCAGWTGVRVYWFGYRVYFNECLTQFIQGMLWAGSGVAAICTAITAYLGGVPVAVICGVAAGLAAIGAGTIQAVDGLGGNQGIIIGTDFFGRVNYLWHQ